MTITQQLLASTVGAATLIGGSALGANAQYVMFEAQPVYTQERVYIEEPIRVRERVYVDEPIRVRRHRYSRPGFSFGIGF